MEERIKLHFKEIDEFEKEYVGTYNKENNKEKLSIVNPLLFASMYENKENDNF